MSKPKTALARVPAPLTEVRKDLEELQRMGLVRELPGERYALTAKGQRVLDQAELSGKECQP